MLSKHKFPTEFSDLIGPLPDPALPAIPQIDWSRLNKNAGNTGIAERIQDDAFKAEISGINNITDIFGRPTTLKKQHPTSVREAIGATVASVIGAMSDDDLQKAWNAPPAEDDLQKRKSEFVKATAESRSKRLWDILNGTVGKHVFSRAGDIQLERTHSAMNRFIEDALMAA
jgi:hypothetical protein